MKHKDIETQQKKIMSIIKKNKDLMQILDYIEGLDLPNFYIVSGSVFQTIWNYLDNKNLNNNIKDIDIIYYDKNNLSKKLEKELEDKIFDHFKSIGIIYEFDVTNEARMHLQINKKYNKKIKQYQNSEDAINQFIVTTHAIGITKEKEKIKVYAPYGLNDIFNKTIRPIKHKGNDQTIYNEKVNSWKKRFDNLNIVEW